MKATCHYRNDPERGLTDPVLEPGGRRFVFRLYSGDVMRPLDGKWFEEPYPTRVLRFFCRLPVLPFITFRWPFLDKACYIGFKVFGVDSPAYLNWLPTSEVYPGSQALCPSFRPFANLE